MPQTRQFAQEITIGSDPEFAIVTPQGRTLSAFDVFKVKNAQSVQFGYDGHEATAEIRPKPATTPKGAVEEVRKILERNKKRYPQVYKNNLMAINDQLSLGGHIHFGHPSFQEDCPQADKNIITLVKNLIYWISLSVFCRRV